MFLSEATRLASLAWEGEERGDLGNEERPQKEGWGQGGTQGGCMVQRQ